jgi:hypothetical protein
VNVKTGELFPATFPDKGPDQALRSARHLTGGQQVMFLLIIFVYLELACLNSIQEVSAEYIESVAYVGKCWGAIYDI